MHILIPETIKRLVEGLRRINLSRISMNAIQVPLISMIFMGKNIPLNIKSRLRLSYKRWGVHRE